MPYPDAIVLTNTKLMKLAAGLAGLDGVRPKPGEFTAFHFDPDLTWKIANNTAVVSEKTALFERTKKSLAVTYQIAEGMAVTKDNSLQVAAFMEALSLLEDHEVDVDGLELLSREKLNVGHDAKKNQNPIPPSVLSALIPILEP